MSTGEVVRKKGRPRKAAAEEIVIAAESPIVKPKKPRATRKSVIASEVVNTRPLADGSESRTRQSGKKPQQIASGPSQLPSVGEALTSSRDALARTGSTMTAPASSPILEKASATFNASRKVYSALSSDTIPSASLPPPETARPRDRPPGAETISMPESTFLSDFLSSPVNPEPWTMKPTGPLSPLSSASSMAFSRSAPVLAQGFTTQLPTAAFHAAPSPPPGSSSGRLPPKLPPTGIPRPHISKPSEMPYEVLKHDPRFKSMSRKYTALMVSIPIALVTSYALYGRYMEQTERKTRPNPPLTNGGV